MYATARVVFGFTALFVLAASQGPAAYAQTQQQLDWCNGKDGAAPDLQISGCSAVIQSGRFTGNNLAIAFKKRCWAYLMLSYKLNSDGSEALADCNEAIRLSPNDAVAIYYRASVYNKMRNINGAIQDYTVLIGLDPKNLNALNNRGLARVSQGQYELAIKDFTEAIKANPNFNTNSETTLTVVTSQSNRCMALALAGKFHEALADCNEAAKLGPKEPSPIGQRGFVYLKMGQWDSAIADYDAALRLDPKKSYFLYGRGVAKLKKRDVAGGNADKAAAMAIYKDVAGEFKSFGFE